MADDDTISQFLAVTGSSDPSIATQYLEMSNNNLEMAISLFMDTGGGGAAASAGGASAAAGGGGGFGGGGIEGDAAMAAALQNEQNGQNEVRAPDATRSMRLVGGPDSPGRGGGGGARLPQGMAGLPGGLPPGVGAFANGRDIPPALLAAMGGPAAREMMRNMAAGDNGMGGMNDVMMGSMGGNWASSSTGGGGGTGG